MADQQLLAQRFEEQRTRLPDPVISYDDGDPEHEALTADAVGLALLVVLETLTPAERLAFALVNGAAGLVTRRNGRMVAVLGFTITHGKIVAIDVLADPERLSRLDNVAG